MRLAVLGLGISGVAVARAAVEQGWTPVVYDERMAESPATLRNLDALGALGVEVVTGWFGRLADDAYDVLVVSPGFPPQHPAILAADRAGKPVWGEIEFAFRIAKAPMVAITGTNGKSTVTVLTWKLVSSSGRRTWLAGNIAGSGYSEHTLTDAARLAAPEDIIVAEISSAQLERIDTFAPQAACVLNVTPDHLDRYPDFATYRATKLKLLEAVADGGTIVRIAGAPGLEDFDPARPEVTVKTIEEASIADPNRDLPAGTPPLNWEDVAIYGRMGRSNFAAAYQLACAVVPNVDPHLALQGYTGLTHRMERVGERDDILVINNSMCTNPGAVISSSQSLNRPQILLMGGHDKGLDFTPVAEYLKTQPHQAILFGPVTETFRACLDAPHVPDLPAAFALAVENCAKKGAILLAPGCASAEPYANFKERGDHFRDIAKEWLEI